MSEKEPSSEPPTKTTEQGTKKNTKHLSLRKNEEKKKDNNWRKRLGAQICAVVSNRLVNKIIIFACLCPLLWLLIYVIVGKAALPGQGIYFSLIAMVAAAHVAGFLFELIRMPGLLGMLLVGIAFKNIPVLNIVGHAIDSNTSAILRFYFPFIHSFKYS